MKDWGEKLIRHITAYPKRYLAGSVSFCLMLICFLPLLETDYSVRIWFRTTDPHLKGLDKMERMFGNDQTATMVIKARDGVFTPKNWKLLQELTDKAWLMPDVVRVDSPVNFSITYAEGDEIIVAPLVDEDIPLSEINFEKIKKEASEHPLLKNRLLDSKGEVAIINAWLRPSLGEEGKESDYDVITNAFRKMVIPYEKQGLEINLTGSAPINTAFKEIGEKDLATIVPFSLGIIAFVLTLIFRQWPSTFAPMVAAVLAMGATFGMAAATGIKFNNTVSAVPGILLAICLADTIHILSTFHQKWNEGLSKLEAMQESLRKNLMPTLLTTMTTAFGFFGLMATELIPIRDMAILACFGTFMAWSLTYFFAGPLILIFSKGPVNVKTAGVDNKKRLATVIGEFFESWVPGLKRHRGKIIIVFTTLVAYCLWLAPKLEVNANPYDYFYASNPVSKSNQYILDNFNGMGGPQLIFDSGSPDGVKSPAFLRKVVELEKWIEAKSFVNQVSGLTDIITDMNVYLNQGQEIFRRIPDTKKAVAEELFLYTLSLPAGLGINNLMSVDQRYLKLSVMWSLQDSKSSLYETGLIEKKAKELGLSMKVSGKMFLYHRMNDYIVETFFKSISIALVLVGLVMMFIFRSVPKGLISLLPNVVPLIFGMGMLYFLKGQIDIGSSLVTSICMGIAVDDTIHFLTHYARERQNGGVAYAIRHTMRYTAPALVFTTACLCAGFGIFVIGDFIPNAFFGVLSSLVLFAALVVDVVFLPAVLFSTEKS